MVEKNIAKEVVSNKIEELPSRTTTIKISIRVWDSLKNLKRENETFDDVIKELLKERTKHLGNENIKAIMYSRKVIFFNTDYSHPFYKKFSVGIEFEYNDVKNQKLDFVLDVKFKKIFFGKKILNPSIFFGVDDMHKHYSNVFLNLYLRAVSIALEKEFRVYSGMYSEEDFVDIAKWRKIYYDYNLSDESFKKDVEEPLRLNEDEPPSDEWRRTIDGSICSSLIKR